MAGNLSVSADIATSGMRVQAERLKVIAQNMANADSISTTPGGEPYRRQVVSFQNYVDKETGAEMVRVDRLFRTCPSLTRNMTRIIREQTLRVMCLCRTLTR